jgi:hypothetical protein
VVKNYLRKVYDKLGVADRLELALYCLNHHVVDNAKVPALPANAVAAGANGNGATSTSSPQIISTMPPAADSSEKL